MWLVCDNSLEEVEARRLCYLLLQCAANWRQYNIPRLYTSFVEPYSSNQYVHISRTPDDQGASR